jgi:hypothetical protein
MGSLVYLSFAAARRSSQPEPEHFWGPLLVLWVGSAARVALAIAHREVFETEATLALLCVTLIPLGVMRSWQQGRSLQHASQVEGPDVVQVNFAAAQARQRKRTRRDFTTPGAM